MGYTPLFDNLLTGTLYGKWPHNGVWACLLSRATREGVINEVPECLADHIGIPVEQLMESIRFFMQPDPGSSTPDHDGRRLELLDEHRPWGWRIINHGKYREKARKSAYDAKRVQSGENAERMKGRRGTHYIDPTGPDATRADPPSEAEAKANKNKSDAFASRPAALDLIRAAYPKREGAQDWPTAEKRIRALIADGTPPADLLNAAERYRKFAVATDIVGTKFVQQASTFFGAKAGWREPWEAKPKPIFGGGIR